MRGKAPNQIHELVGERTVIGRHPNCEIVLESAAVSRHHAQILANHGRFYVEDLRSRNHTLLNGNAISGRDRLNHGDSIQVCDVVFRFDDQKDALPGDESASVDHTEIVGKKKKFDTLPEGFPAFSFDESEVDDPSSIITTINTRSSSTKFRLGVKPEAKLRAVLEIGRTLASVLNLDEVFQKTLDGLFQLYPQADEGFVLLRNLETKKVVLKAIKTRTDATDGTARISMTIVKQAIDSGNAVLTGNALNDVRFKSSESVSELEIKSTMCVPLLDKAATALGIIQLSSHDLRRPFSQDDLDLLVSVAAQIGMAVENARLHEELLEQREMERDLEFATQIQLGFLPDKRPSVPGYDFDDYYESALKVGGDYFDYIALPEGRVAAAIGDVAGKGVPAALLMARLYSSARFHLLTQANVAEALGGLNAEFASSGLGFRFITFVAAVIDPKSHEITIGNAGHLAPIVRRADGTVEFIGKSDSGMPLGVAPQEVFREVTISLGPNEMLLMYTDGITESMNAKNKIYGRERLAKYLSKAPIDAAKTVHGLVNDVERFCAGRAQRDDMCLVCIVRRE